MRTSARAAKLYGPRASLAHKKKLHEAPIQCAHSAGLNLPTGMRHETNGYGFGDKIVQRAAFKT